jgi:hypothetical protein
MDMVSCKAYIRSCCFHLKNCQNVRAAEVIESGLSMKTAVAVGGSRSSHHESMICAFISFHGIISESKA